VGYNLKGQFDGTLDEKGRISLPSTLRKILNDAEVTIKPCDYEKEKCLWLFPTAVYNEMSAKYNKNTDILSEKDRAFRRRFFNSKDVEIDKAGRIPIPQNYREEAGLTKDCLFIGAWDYIEIWDKETYRKYYSESKDDFVSASEELASKLKNNKGGDQE